MNYEEMSVILKALADPKRLKIIDLLSCGSLCACDILDHFEFTQPTLSHHMKVLKRPVTFWSQRRVLGITIN